jgi:hypothetical protein
MEPRYWIGVVSQAHVERGTAGGFCQLCHGKAQPLHRMNTGDWLIYYSPKTDFHAGVPCQAFTAIGQIQGDGVYQVDLGDFSPYRRDVAYLPCQAAPIGPLLDQLSFIPDPKRWGFPFRRGHFEITAADFAIIAGAMGVQPVDVEEALHV